MTGSTSSGPLQPQKVSAPSIPFEATLDDTSAASGHRHRICQKMTSTPSSGQPIQLTPVWEHVVRTRKFPSEIDTHSTFIEISERLRDPEWEVRQHALRVLMDVLPTLNADIVDKVMQPVTPELINNLGHPAPAVRKGALDTLRVYLVHSRDRDSVVRSILQDGLNRPDAHDPFQTNVTTGVILSAPLLLFPSSSSPRPNSQVLKDTTVALASRLVHVPHQEAVLKSLLKIRDVVGNEEFNDYLSDYNGKVKEDIETLSKVYNLKPPRKNQRKSCNDVKKPGKLDQEFSLDKSWDSDSDTSGIAEEEDEMTNGAMPPARVVLETEIKFNEETAITMTILEEKDEESDQQEEDKEEVQGKDASGINNAAGTEVIEDSDRRRTTRRVHFGGEIVKLRTPDSDETESIEAMTPKTRIPLPIFPATKMPEMPRRRPSSQPCSPHLERRRMNRTSSSLSSSPKREVYVHNADLSPKKSILMRTGSPVFVIKPVEQGSKKRKGSANQENSKRDNKGRNDQVANEVFGCSVACSQPVEENVKKEDVQLVQTVPGNTDAKNSADVKKPEEQKKMSVSSENDNSNEKYPKTEGNSLSKESEKINHSNNVSVSEVNEAKSIGFLKQGQNYVFKEQTSTTQGNLASCFGPEVEEDIDDLPFNSVVSNIFNNSVPTIEKREETKTDDNTKIEANLQDKVVPQLSTNETAPDEGNTVINQNSEFSACGSAKARKDQEITKEDGGDQVSKFNSEQVPKSDEKRIALAESNGNTSSSGNETESRSHELNWEELGLVEPDVLEDLHNKDDWRARVRALERIATALRTSSALVAIEPRLGSLLHTVLGGERSCRVAAAGLAVAKVVVTGVTEDALKKRLPQLAWGLARQGGPNAAQLARIAMLRLRPALFLEQLLQPQCLSARNAKTRENTLQLLIFSLVTFPSTEFKIETVAHKVALMVADRRRRVRQAALDTLAVLAQIYEPEEVLKAGKRVSEGRHDGKAMMAAVRARLARKSLPLVSADGLVVYGLQISPTVQIATGPDVDWIVAGSGSVSPGTGRTRGQIIATTGSERGRISRNNSTKSRESPWTDRSNFVALGVGLHPKAEQPVAWQLVPTQNQDDIRYREELDETEGRNSKTGVINGKNTSMRLEDQLHMFSTNGTYTSGGRECASNFEDSNNCRNTDGRAREKENTNYKTDSKIPVLSSRGLNAKSVAQCYDKSTNVELPNSSLRRKTKDAVDSNGNRLNSQETNIRSYQNTYQRRKRFQHDNTSEITKSFDSHRNSYRPVTKDVDRMNKQYDNIIDSSDQTFSEVDSHDYQRFDEDRYSKDSDDRNRHSRSSSMESRYRSLPKNERQILPTYIPIQQRHRRFTDVQSFRALQTAPPLTRIYQEDRNLNQEIIDSNERYPFPWSRTERRMKDAEAQKITNVELISTDVQTNGHSQVKSPHRRRLRSLSPSQLSRQRHFVKMASSKQASSMYDIDKAVNEEEYNERNKQHCLSEPESYEVQTLNRDNSLRQGEDQQHVFSKSAGGSLSSATRNNRRSAQDIACDREDSSSNSNSNNSRSSTPHSEDIEAAFNVITHQGTPQGQDTVDSYRIPSATLEAEGLGERVIASIEEDTSKEWSSEEEIKSRNQVSSRCSNQFLQNDEDRHIQNIENDNASDSSSDEEIGEQAEAGSVRRRSIISVISNERVFGAEVTKISNELLQSSSPNDFYNIQSPVPKEIFSPKKTESPFLHQSPSNLHNSENPSRSSSQKSSVNNQDGRTNEDAVVSSMLSEENASFQPFDIAQSNTEVINSAAILISSTPLLDQASKHSENLEEAVLHNNNNTQESTEDSSSNDVLEDRHSKDSASETNTEPGILKIETPVEIIDPLKKLTSKVPRNTSRFRAVHNKTSSGQKTEKTVEKAKPIMQQCFAQLENKDWEVTVKGLKTLSQIAKQYPHQLDAHAAGSIGRLLGRHIRNLRSQVSRAACLAAGDLFSSQIRGIDQDLDDIAGPLLHRTADTNRFLRADSNAALDCMVEHLPPQKTIVIIVQRGANHQNAIVRAATARLLSEIVERVGPTHVMVLPRDVKEKLFSAGAKLLMDGNLDARNHAKNMFRQLTRCEGFHKVLTDAVPETTLRHIDKTLRSL